MHIDLSHTIEHGMITYRGLPAPLICDFLTREASRALYSPGTEFHIGRIDMVANTGTYVDAPFHRYAHGADVGALPLERLAELPGIVVDATGRRVDQDLFAGRDLAGRAVLVRTGWDAHWRTPRYAEGHPHLTRAAAEFLAGAGPALVGIDSLNIDDTADPARPVHSALLAADIPIVEHLRGLGQLPDGGFRFFAAPVKFRGLGSFPVRAFGLVPRHP